MKKISELKRDWLHREIAILLSNGLTKADISRKLQVKPQYLNTLLNSDRGITDQFLDKFIETFRLTQFDLLENKVVPIDNISLLDIIEQNNERIEELSKQLGRLEQILKQ